jgi:hypothetical protein
MLIILKRTIRMLILINMILNIDGYILSKTSIYKNVAKIKRETLKLRSSNSNIAVCNEKYIYMKYLIGIRNFKKVYRIFKNTHEADIQNIINILNVLNYINNTQLSNMTNSDMTNNNSIYINNNLFQNNSLVINNTGVNNEKIAKNLILSNIFIDVSTVKYIRISTRNDTLVVELDKNNVDISSTSSNNILNIMYDISKIETLVSSISLLLKVININ